MLGGTPSAATVVCTQRKNMASPLPDKASTLDNRRLTWKTWLVLMLAALVGAIAILPYALALTPPALPPGGPPLAVLLVLSVLQTLVLVGIATAVGLWLGPTVGLGAPLLRAWLAGDANAPRQFRASLPLAAALGLASGIAIVVLDVFAFAPYLRGALPAATPKEPDAWRGLLASLYGGIDEELLLRLGFMTLLAWLGSKVSRANGPPSSGVMWTANILAALLFGVGHLPATAAVLPLTWVVVVRAIVLNGLGGVVFGWLYWRRGMLSAMASHFCADLVLHVLSPLLVSAN